MISLQQLRNPYFMKWGLWAILIVTIPAFVALYGFAPPSQQSGMPTGALVTVNTPQGRVELDRNDLQRAKGEAADYFTNLASLAMGIRPEQRGQAQRMIFDALTTEEVTNFAIAQVAMRQRLDAQGLRVSDNQVTTWLRSQGITRQDLRRILEQNRLTEAEYAAIIRGTIADTLAQNTVNRTARTSLLELWQEYLLGNEILTAEIVRVPVTLDNDMVVSDDDISAEYDRMVAANDSRIIQGAQRVYRHVTISAPSQFPPRATDADVLSAFEQGLVAGRYRENAGFSARQIVFSDASKGDPRARAEAALIRLNAGESFGLLANELSDDPNNSVALDGASSPTLMNGVIGSAILPSDAGRFGNEMISFLQNATPGAVSGILTTPMGVTIVELIDNPTGAAYDFVEVRDSIRTEVNDRLRDEHEATRQTRIMENFDRLRDSSARATTLEGVARALSSDVRTTSPTLATSSFIMGIGDLSRESQAIRRLRPGIISPVLQARDGSVTILELVSEVPESVRPLSEVRTVVERAVRRNVAVEEARLLANALKARVEAGGALSSAALTLDLAGETLEPFTRQELPSAFDAALDAEDQLTRGRLGDFIVLEGGSPSMITELIAVSISNVQEPTRQQFLADISELERAYLFAKRQGYVEDFRRDAVASLRERARFHRDFDPSR